MKGSLPTGQLSTGEQRNGCSEDSWSGRPADLKLVAHHELDSVMHIDFHNEIMPCRVVAA